MDVQAARTDGQTPVIPTRTTTLAAYARAVKHNEPPEVVADALALDTAARLQEQILAAFDRSPIDPDDADELADLLRSGGAS
ncbi:hypothetical protein GCM10009815_13560 [Nocardioides marmoribigeumensis]